VYVMFDYAKSIYTPYYVLLTDWPQGWCHANDGFLTSWSRPCHTSSTTLEIKQLASIYAASVLPLLFFCSVKHCNTKHKSHGWMDGWSWIDAKFSGSTHIFAYAVSNLKWSEIKTSYWPHLAPHFNIGN
jgi:hypothetical protein